MKSLITSIQPAFSSWRMKLASLALICAAALFCLAAGSGPHSERGNHRLQKLAGAWSVQVTVEIQQATFPSLITFMSDGTMLTDEPPNPFETSGHGNWVATSPREAAFTFRAFAAIELGPVTSAELKVVGKLEYDARADTWSGPFKIQLFDADGNEIFADTGTFTGTRIAVETLD